MKPSSRQRLIQNIILIVLTALAVMGYLSSCELIQPPAPSPTECRPGSSFEYQATSQGDSVVLSVTYMSFSLPEGTGDIPISEICDTIRSCMDSYFEGIRFVPAIGFFGRNDYGATRDAMRLFECRFEDEKGIPIALHEVVALTENFTGAKVRDFKPCSVVGSIYEPRKNPTNE